MSGKIRTAIGLAKRRLRFALDTELDTVDSLVGEAPEDIYDAIVETVDLACTIRTERTRILELDRTWGELIKNDPQEKQQLDDYKRRLECLQIRAGDDHFGYRGYRNMESRENGFSPSSIGQSATIEEPTTSTETTMTSLPRECHESKDHE
uniref:Rx_N domain-containing protein n=1 Tax=Caenorhabditis tropicalis TaxID=1561998 RepID=A0A1I7UJE1_9PELO